jgi:hypothetical protein
MTGPKAGRGSVWEVIRDQLRAQGIDLEASFGGPDGTAAVKVVCVAPNLKESVEEMGRSTRDHVVMVRVDEETLAAIDAWVETGHVRSRSEAAALFMREGVKIRAAELERLKDALREVEQAKARLREKARDVFGGDGRPGDR